MVPYVAFVVVVLLLVCCAGIAVFCVAMVLHLLVIGGLR